MTSVTTSAFDLPPTLATKDDPALIAGDEQHFATLAEIAGGVHRPPVRPPRRAAHGRRWQRPAGSGTRPGDPPADRSAAGAAPVRAGPVPGADRPARTAPSRSTSAALDSPTAPADSCSWTGAPPPPSRSSERRTPTRWAWSAVAATAGPVAGSATTGTRCSPPTGSRGTRPPSTTSRRSSPASAAAGRRRCGTCSARSRPTRTRSSARGPAAALVVDGGPGTGKTVVALHRTAYLLYSDPRLGHRRGGVLVRRAAPALPELRRGRAAEPRRGGRADLHRARPRPRGCDGRRRGDPEVARLKSSAQMVTRDRAGGPALRGAAGPGHGGRDPLRGPLAQRRPTGPRRSRRRSGTPHNEARDDILDELVTILVDKHEDEEVPTGAAAPVADPEPGAARHPQHRLALIEATDLVADLWSVPAYLRRCAPWLETDEVRALQREDPQAWTVSDLPLLDAARQRLGDPEASRRRRRRDATLAAEREEMAKVVDHLIETDDSEMHLMSMLKVHDLQGALVDESALPDGRPRPARRSVRAHRRGRGAGADRRRVADAAAAVPVAQLHHRRRPRPGPARVRRVVGRNGSSASASTGSAWRR